MSRADFCTEKHVKPRKAHRCWWCDEQVPAGEQCFYVSGSWDGDFSWGHLHLECETAWREWGRNNEAVDQGFTIGDMMRGKAWSKDDDAEFREYRAAQEREVRGG